MFRSSGLYCTGDYSRRIDSPRCAGIHIHVQIWPAHTIFLSIEEYTIFSSVTQSRTNMHTWVDRTLSSGLLGFSSKFHSSIGSWAMSKPSRSSREYETSASSTCLSHIDQEVSCMTRNMSCTLRRQIDGTCYRSISTSWCKLAHLIHSWFTTLNR